MTTPLTEAQVQKVENALRSRIAKSKLKPGDRIPSLRKLASDLDTSFYLVREAVQRLVRSGYLVAHWGHGHVLAGELVSSRVRVAFYRYGKDVSIPLKASTPDSLVMERLAKLGELEAGIRESLAAVHGEFVIPSDPMPGENWTHWVRQLMHQGITGVIAYGLNSTEAQQALASMHMPTVLLGSDQPHTHLHSIVTAEYEAGAAMASIGLKLGHRRIMMVAKSSTIQSHRHPAGAASSPETSPLEGEWGSHQRFRGTMATLQSASAILKTSSKLMIRTVALETAAEDIPRELGSSSLERATLVIAIDYDGKIFQKVRQSGIQFPKAVSFIAHSFLRTTHPAMSMEEVLQKPARDLLIHPESDLTDTTTHAAVGWNYKAMGIEASSQLVERANPAETAPQRRLLQPLFRPGYSLASASE